MMPGWERYASDPKVKERREAQQRAATELRAEGLPVTAKAIEERRVADKGLGSIPDINMDAVNFVYLSLKNYSNFTSHWLDECPPPKPLAPEETIVTAIIGWRRWTVEMFGNVLRSNNGVKWGVGEKLVAECKRDTLMWRFSTPDSHCQGIHCTCGIYAYKSQSLIETGENAPAGLLHVYGEVYLWGRVVEHAKGYRGQYAYPKAFVDTGGIARQLAKEYGVGLIDGSK